MRHLLLLLVYSLIATTANGGLAPQPCRGRIQSKAHIHTSIPFVYNGIRYNPSPAHDTLRHTRRDSLWADSAYAAGRRLTRGYANLGGIGVGVGTLFWAVLGISAPLTVWLVGFGVLGVILLAIIGFIIWKQQIAAATALQRWGMAALAQKARLNQRTQQRRQARQLRHDSLRSTPSGLSWVRMRWKWAVFLASAILGLLALALGLLVWWEWSIVAGVALLIVGGGALLLALSISQWVAARHPEAGRKSRLWGWLSAGLATAGFGMALLFGFFGPLWWGTFYYALADLFAFMGVIALGVGLILWLTTGIIHFVRLRNRLKRAAEAEMLRLL